MDNQFKNNVSSSGQSDQMGPYPADLHVAPLEGRRYLWTSRAFAIALYISLILNLILAIAVSTAWNLREIVPMLVQFDEKKDTFVRILPVDKNMPGLQFMTEKLLGEYIKMREEVVLNSDEMKERYEGYIANRTAKGEYENFVREKSTMYKSLIEQEITRKVDIETVDLTPKGYYTVDYTTRDFDIAQNQNNEEKWRAYVTVKYVAREMPYSERFVNPLGFQVQRFSKKPRD